MKKAFPYTLLLFILLAGVLFSLSAQSFYQRNRSSSEVVNLGPSSWWVNLSYNRPLLILYGQGISKVSPAFNHPGVNLHTVYPVSNPNYLIFDLNIAPEASPGIFSIRLPGFGRGNESVPFEILQSDSKPNPGVLQAGDMIYQIVPDRFSNSNPENDNPPGYLERSDRLNPSGIHGGDLAGITSHLEYISGLGATTIELTPVYQSNQFILSYEHMAPTHFFEIDPHLGTINDFRSLTNNAHRDGLKIILSLLLNQAGSQHPLIKDPPDDDWSFPVAKEFVEEQNPWLFADPYASATDRQKYRSTLETMDAPILNQDNELVQKHLIQHLIWWIMQTNVDGIRIENTHLNQPAFLGKTISSLKQLFPNLNLIASTQSASPAHNYYWQHPASEESFTHITDGPLYEASREAFTAYQDVNRAIYPLYTTASSDFLYSNPSNQLLIYADQPYLSRAYTMAEKDPAIFRVMMGFTFTFRGIPSLLYGSEIMMPGMAGEGLGLVRAPLPGGWPDNKASVFNPQTLSADRQESLKFMRRLLNWRKNNSELMQGELTHFEPQNGLYIYMRTTSDKALLVVINNHRSEQQHVIFSKLAPQLSHYKTGRDIISGALSADLERLFVAPKSIVLLELQP